MIDKSLLLKRISRNTKKTNPLRWAIESFNVVILKKKSFKNGLLAKIDLHAPIINQGIINL